MFVSTYSSLSVFVHLIVISIYILIANWIFLFFSFFFALFHDNMNQMERNTHIHTWLTFPNQYDNGARHVFFPGFIVIHSFIRQDILLVSLYIPNTNPENIIKKSNDKVDGNWIVCIDLIVFSVCSVCFFITIF